MLHVLVLFVCLKCCTEVQGEPRVVVVNLSLCCLSAVNLVLRRSSSDIRVHPKFISVNSPGQNSNPVFVSYTFKLTRSGDQRPQAKFAQYEHVCCYILKLSLYTTSIDGSELSPVDKTSKEGKPICAINLRQIPRTCNIKFLVVNGHHPDTT